MKASDKAWREQKSTIVVHGRITEVGREGIPAVLCVDALEVLCDLVKSFVPCDTLPTLRSAAYGILESVFIVVEILKSDSLWADVPAAKRIIFVAPNVETLIGLNSDLDPTNRFAEIAGLVVRRTLASVTHDESGIDPAISQICVMTLVSLRLGPANHQLGS
jgi:hypothetical protein